MSGSSASCTSSPRREAGLESDMRERMGEEERGKGLRLKGQVRGAATGREGPNKLQGD